MIVTAILGSYHKGNTYSVIRKIEERMKQHGDVDFHYLFLTEADLSRCRGCFVCISKGETLCPLKDGLLDIEKRLMESDGVIFASPNYACGVTSIMKGFIERFAYIGHRPRFFGKYALAVAVSAGPVGIKETLEDLRYFAGGGFEFTGNLGLMIPPFSTGEKAKKRNDARINAAADCFYRAMAERKQSHPTYASIMQFASFRALYRIKPELGAKSFPADMAYWTERGWLDQGAKYFLKVPIGPVKRAFGLLFEKIVSASSSGIVSDR